MRQLTQNVYVETEQRGSNHGIVTATDGIVLIDGDAAATAVSHGPGRGASRETPTAAPIRVRHRDMAGPSTPAALTACRCGTTLRHHVQ